MSEPMYDCEDMENAQVFELLEPYRKQISDLTAKLAACELRWQTGKPPKEMGLYFVRGYQHQPDRGIGIYTEGDGEIWGLTGAWSADPNKEEWAGPLEPPKEGGMSVRDEYVNALESRNNYLADRVADLRKINSDLTAKLQAAEELIYSQGRSHQQPCTFGPLCPYCEIDRLAKRISTLESRNAELVEGLRKLEWCANVGFCFGEDGKVIANPPACPACRSLQMSGHLPDCWLAKLVEGDK